MGRSIPWGEAIRLVHRLRSDPSSMLAASAEGWEYPVTRAEAIAMDTYDLTYAATGAKNRKEYPRPYKRTPAATKHGDAAGQSPVEVIARLRPVA